MPKSNTVQEPANVPAQNRPLDDESLTHLLRTTLFSGTNEEQRAQAEIEPEVETDAEPEEVTEEVETTEPESDETTDEADEAEEDEPKEEEPKDESPQYTKGVQKRIDKLVAQKKEAEEKLRALTEEVERSKTMANTSEKEFIPVGDGINPYFKLQSEREVQDEIRHARSIRRWAEENADGAVVRGKDGNEVDYSAEEIRQIKLNAIDALEEHLPKQLSYVNSRKAFDAEAERLYPFWKQRQSTEYQLANTILREFPELQKFPDFRISLGDMVAGRLAREGAAKKRLPVVTKKAPAMPRSTLAPARSDSATAKYSQADQSFRQNPTSLDALQHLVATKFL